MNDRPAVLPSCCSARTVIKLSANTLFDEEFSSSSGSGPPGDRRPVHAPPDSELGLTSLFLFPTGDNRQERRRKRRSLMNRICACLVR